MDYFAGFIGLIIGSFLNVCIARLPWDYSVTSPRSHCYGCGRTIAWFDNIPVLGWLLLRARCRYCKSVISWRYPLVEALTGILFFIAVHQAGWNWAGLKWCIFSAWMIELGFSDLDTRILPDEFTKSGLLAGLFLAPVVLVPQGVVSLLADAQPAAFASLVDAVAGAVFLAGTFSLIAAFYHRWRGVEGLGQGDVKLVAMIGIFLGLDAGIFAVAFSSVFGLLVGGAWILIKRKDSHTYELPYGSFLSAGGLLLMLVQLWPEMAWINLLAGPDSSVSALVPLQ